MAKIKHLELIPNSFKETSELKPNVTRLLFVEGVSDAHIVQHLIKHIDTTHTIQLVATSGQFHETSVQRLQRLLSSGNFSQDGAKVGLIADLDTLTSNAKLALIQSKLLNNPTLSYPFSSLEFNMWQDLESSIGPFSVFFVPMSYTNSNEGLSSVGSARQGTMEHYFIEQYWTNKSSVEPSAQLLNTVFSTNWWGGSSCPITLENAKAKWLSAAMLLSLANGSIPLSKCRTDIGLATESGYILPNNWPNLQALRDYLTAFLQ